MSEQSTTETAVALGSFGANPDETGEGYDWPALTAELDRLLRIRTTPIGMKLFERRRGDGDDPSPPPTHSDPHDRSDRRPGVPARVDGRCDNGGPRRGSVRSCDRFAPPRTTSGCRASAWPASGTPPSRTRPLTRRRWTPHPSASTRRWQCRRSRAARLDPPDICLIYATPAQMILLINGLQWSGYKKFEWGCVGESACADSWGRALATGEPSLSLPVLRRAALRRRDGGRAADGDAAPLPAPHPRRAAATRWERLALPDPAIWCAERLEGWSRLAATTDEPVVSGRRPTLSDQSQLLSSNRCHHRPRSSARSRNSRAVMRGTAPRYPSLRALPIDPSDTSGVNPRRGPRCSR